VNSDARHRLETVLDREIQMAGTLASTLADEHEALIGKSPADVVQKAQAKVALLGQLEMLERERTALWQPAAAQDNPGVAQRWQSLLAMMTRCRTANEVNGYIINVRRSQVGQLLDALRGSAPAIYGPQGKTYGRAQRALATA
jgi:flagellar biosynthesis/type III secretory pathway chaperone